MPPQVGYARETELGAPGLVLGAQIPMIFAGLKPLKGLKPLIERIGKLPMLVY